MWCLCRYNRAISYFLRATDIISAQDLIDNHILPNSAQHQRKVERLGAKQRREYLAKRKALRDAFVKQYRQRQLGRAVHSHAELFRLYLIEHNRQSARRHLLRSFELCDDLEIGPMEYCCPDIDSYSSGEYCEWTGHDDDEWHSSRHKNRGAAGGGAADSRAPAVVGDGARLRTKMQIFAHGVLREFIVSSNAPVHPPLFSLRFSLLSCSCVFPMCADPRGPRGAAADTYSESFRGTVMRGAHSHSERLDKQVSRCRRFALVLLTDS